MRFIKWIQLHAQHCYIYTHIHIHIHILIRIHTHTHAHLHIHTQLIKCSHVSMKKPPALLS